MSSNRAYDSGTDPAWRIASDPAGINRGVHTDDTAKLWCIYLNGGGNPVTGPIVPLVAAQALPAEVETRRIARAAADVLDLVNAGKRATFLARIQQLHDACEADTLTLGQARVLLKHLCRMVGVGGPAQDP